MPENFDGRLATFLKEEMNLQKKKVSDLKKLLAEKTKELGEAETELDQIIRIERRFKR